MSTRSNIAIKLKEEDRHRDFIAPDNSVFNPGGKAYLQIYCHFDGYPDGVGQDLLDAKFTYEEALNFIMLGGHSTVEEAYIERGEKWQDNKPSCKDKPYCYEEYLYCFMDDAWFIETSKGWVLVSEVLDCENLYDEYFD